MELTSALGPPHLLVGSTSGESLSLRSESSRIYPESSRASSRHIAEPDGRAARGGNRLPCDEPRPMGRRGRHFWRRRAAHERATDEQAKCFTRGRAGRGRGVAKLEDRRQSVNLELYQSHVTQGLVELLTAVINRTFPQFS